MASRAKDARAVRSGKALHEVEAPEALGKLTGLVYGSFLLQCVDQMDGGEETDLLAVMLDCLQSEVRFKL